MSEPGAASIDQSRRSPPPPELELPPALRQHLLDPAAWQEGLERYARATNLAVALVDTDGGLLGPCINPRPTWRLLRARRPTAAGSCPFCLMTLQPPSCVADALTKGGFHVTRDRTGLVHVTVPLVLGEHALGALVAGQVFDQYPEPRVLEHVAVTFGLRPQPVWQLARLELPVKQATLRVYADLLATLGHTFLRTCYDRAIEANRLAEMTRLRDLLQQRTEDLTAADRQKDVFLATLAHELRNPLAPIRNAVHLMQRTSPADPEVHWGLDVIDRQLQQMTRLIDDLLDLSRITRNTLELRTEHLNLGEVLAVAVETSRPLIEVGGQTFVTALPSEPIALAADPVRLAQVITNLLTNAAKYTERGGHIWLTAERHGDEAVVTVRDTGIGIPAELLPRLFDMFTQGEQSRERTQGGLGIGLTLAQWIVARHSGSITAHSDGPGHGSTFIVRLPVSREPSPAQPREGRTHARMAPTIARRILVVDDEWLSAASWGRLLELEGHEIRTAHDGLEAVEVAEAFQPDVMLLDIGLPKLNGYEVARRIRYQAWGQAIVLIALTGWGQAADRERSTAAGFDHHLVKPVDPAELMHLLAVLSSRG
jgi:signal transduction histidine kinase/ActR/RegA family two-component response regulator